MHLSLFWSSIHYFIQSRDERPHSNNLYTTCSLPSSINHGRLYQQLSDDNSQTTSDILTNDIRGTRGALVCCAMHVAEQWVVGVSGGLLFVCHTLGNQQKDNYCMGQPVY